MTSSSAGDRPNATTVRVAVLVMIIHVVAYPLFAYIYLSTIPGAIDSVGERLLSALCSPLFLILLAVRPSLRKYSHLMVMVSLTSVVLHVLTLVLRNELAPLYVMGFLVIVAVALAFIFQIRLLVAFALITIAAAGIVALVADAPTTPPLIFFTLTVAEAGLAALVNGQKLLGYRKIDAQQQRLLESRRLAAVGILAAGVAHEINNPLTSLQGRVHLLGRQLEEGTAGMDDVAASLAKIDKTVERIADTVRNLLEFSGQADAGAREAECQVCHAVVAAEKFLALRLRSAGVEVKVTCPEALWVRGEVALVTPIVVTLVANAIDAVRDLPHEDRWISIRGWRQGGEVLLVVANGGSGLVPDLAEQIFLPFFTTKDPGQGSGMGLSIGLRAAEQLGGSLRLLPSTTVTEFELRLPQTTGPTAGSLPTAR